MNFEQIPCRKYSSRNLLHQLLDLGVFKHLEFRQEFRRQNVLGNNLELMPALASASRKQADDWMDGP
jgi:hypothetical protein